MPATVQEPPGLLQHSNLFGIMANKYSSFTTLGARTATLCCGRRQWVRRQEATAGGAEVLARCRTSEAEAGLRTGRDVGDTADCDIEARGGNGVVGNDTKGTRAQAESGLPCETKRSNTGLKSGAGQLRACQEA